MNGINPISKRRKERLKQYAKLKTWFWKHHALCERCQGKPTDIHHLHGRAGILLIVWELWAPLCRACHNFVREHPIQARAEGFLAPAGQWNTLPQHLREKYRDA